ncbi:HSF-type DNA-binding-domain-containing protein [Chytridium lagenaria]|nr:HSF-type DNA-binding-domain-containing protein [Chytridium lagenaria]
MDEREEGKEEGGGVAVGKEEVGSSGVSPKGKGGRDFEVSLKSPGNGKRSSGPPDFVKKLFRMLENDTDSELLIWGVNGDSFVVKDPSDFARKILPKHFKHNNFASFVRQLNKYDFHKVKEKTYGELAWEFRHDEFRVGQIDKLEKIRRKSAKKLKKPELALPDDIVDVDLVPASTDAVELPTRRPRPLRHASRHLQHHYHHH